MHLALYRVQPLFYSEVKGGKVSTSLFRPRKTVLFAVFITAIKGTATSERRGLSWLTVWRNTVHTWRGRNSRRKLTAMAVGT